MVQVLPSKEEKLRNVRVVKEEKDFSPIKNLVTESPLVLATCTFYCFKCISFDQLLITFYFTFFASVCSYVQKIF